MTDHNDYPELVGEEGVTNLFILDFLVPKCVSYRGVFSANNLDKRLQKTNEPFTITCNLSPNDSAGSHFVTIVHLGDSVLYVDSLGIPCLIEEIRQFLDGFDKPVLFNDTAIQNPKSAYCGMYAILFSLHFDRLFTAGVQAVMQLTFEVDGDEETLFKNDDRCISYIDAYTDSL